MDYVAGYTVVHDVSARDWQLKKNSGQWLIGKTFDSFCPIGPAIVTKDSLSGNQYGLQAFSGCGVWAVSARILVNHSPLVGFAKSLLIIAHLLDLQNLRELRKGDGKGAPPSPLFLSP